MEDNHPKIDEKFMEEAMQSFEKAWRSGELRELMRKYPRCKPLIREIPKEYVLLDRCMALPLRLDDVEAELKSGGYSPDEITRCAIKFTESCDSEYGDFEAENHRPPCNDELHGSNLPELIQLFCNYGLRPNAVYGEANDRQNLLYTLSAVDAGYAAADAMRILLECGGDPNLMLDDESVFDSLDFEIVFGAVEQEDRRVYDDFVHTWLVLIGYGGRIHGKKCPVEMRGNCEPEIFQKHENFDFCLDFQSDYSDGWRMSIFDRNSKAVVAVL